MKPGLAVLPLEVWADVFEHPMITRQEMAQIADNNGDPEFTEKLQKLLHGCGKHTLGYMNIFLNQCGEPQNRAYIKVSSKDCQFPESEMPENIKSFKELSIGHFDDEVLDFLHKIKPLFTNVYLYLRGKPRIAFHHLLPMLGGIRTIYCGNESIQMLEEHFPGTLARAKELELSFAVEASIPALLNWLSAPQNFEQHGPRFSKVDCGAEPETTTAIVEAVRKHFLAATIPSTFVLYLEHFLYRRATEDRTIQNAATKEELAIRNVIFKVPEDVYPIAIHYVEILRNPVGDNAKMRKWAEKRAYFEKHVNRFNSTEDDGAEQQIYVSSPTIGQITNKKADPDGEEDKAGPSTLAMEK